MWSAEIQYRGGKAGSLQEIFARAQNLKAESICIHHSKLKCYGTLQELQEYAAPYEVSTALIDLYESYTVGGKEQLDTCVTYLVQLGISVADLLLEEDEHMVMFFRGRFGEFCALLAGYTDGSFVEKLTNPTYKKFFDACYSQV